jgi:integrase
MTVYRDKSRWRYHFEYQLHRYTKRGFATRKAAADAEHAHRKALEAGRLDPYPTFADLVGAFLTSSQRTKSADWCYQLEKKLNRGFATLALLPPRQITTAHVDRCLTQLAASRRGARSLNEYRKIILAVLNYGVKAGALEGNVAARIPKVPEPAVEIQPIPQAHLQQLILGADGALAALLTVQSQTGARFVELRRLNVAEVFLEGARPFCLLTTRKNVGGHERKRPQPLTGFAVAALRPLLARGREYVFAGLQGGRMSYDAELHRLHALCDRLGLPRYGFHQMRHWAGYVATAGGGSKKAIARFLGHTNTGVTERYLHTIDAELWAVAARLEAAMVALTPPAREESSGT